MKDVNSMKVQYYRIEFEFDIYIIVEQKKIKIYSGSVVKTKI